MTPGLKDSSPIKIPFACVCVCVCVGGCLWFVHFYPDIERLASKILGVTEIGS